MSARQPGAVRGQARHWTSREAIAWEVTVSPGTIRVGTRKVGHSTQDEPDSRTEMLARAWANHDERISQLDLEWPEPYRRVPTEQDIERARQFLEGGEVESGSARSEITEWSAKSRARMVERLGSLDYGPLFKPGRSAAMVTLTLPGDWLTVAPTGKHFKRLIEAFKVRYERAWGEPLRGIWKVEFQRRGAPHVHILMTVPTGKAGAGRVGKGNYFPLWCSKVWAAVCKHPDPEQYRRHLMAGTGVDYAEGQRATDPKRVAVYFTKHAAPGGAADKEYQHRVPAEWQAPGAGPGRFWGVWGLEVAAATGEVGAEDAITAARILRRWSHAQRGTRRVRVWRPRFDPDTGEIRGNPWRRSTVRAVRMAQGRGFICLNDAPAMLSQIARYLDAVRGPDGEPGHR